MEELKFTLTRIIDEPILSPKLSWEKEGVFNPGVIKVGEETIMLYRAVGEKDAYISHLGLAKSNDGVHFERVGDIPVYGPQYEFDKWATEDPRITFLEGSYYITYVAVPERILENGHGVKRDLPLITAGALLKTSDFKTFENLGLITPFGSDNKDAVLLPQKINGKYGMYHRPNRWAKQWFGGEFHQLVDEHLPCSVDELPDKPSIWYSESEDLINWTNHRVALEAPKETSLKIGPGLPPIYTKDGWVVIYHQVENNNGVITYHAAAALFNLTDPTKCVSRLPYYILSPEKPFEEHIVFPTGGTVTGDVLNVYYGASDISIGVATGSLSELVSVLLAHAK